MKREEPVYIVTDQGLNTGIGRYALGVYDLLRDFFPSLRLFQLSHLKSVTLPNAEKPSIIKDTTRILEFPFRKCTNLKKIKLNNLFLNSNIHLCGADYSLTSESPHTICTIHDYFFRIPSFGLLRNPKELFSEIYIDYYNLVIPMHLKRSGIVLVTNSWVQNEVMRKLGIRSKVITMWVDDRFRKRERGYALERLRLPKKKKLLLNVSGPGENKNLTTLKRIADALPDDHVLIKIGYPILGKNVVNMGFVPESDYPYFFNAAYFYINTSIREGFCIPLIEAISSGLPVITPDISPFSDILGNAAAYVQDPMNEIEYISQINANSVHIRYDDLVGQSIEKSKDFNREKARASLIDTYRSIFSI